MLTSDIYQDNTGKSCTIYLIYSGFNLDDLTVKMMERKRNDKPKYNMYLTRVNALTTRRRGV